jgi:hypothetical protein
MMDRRRFLWEAPAVAAFARSAWAQSQETPAKITHVDIVHHTHTDVGYTALPSVIRDLQRRYLDAAVDTCRSDRNFHWTVESLLGLEDWWQVSTLARRNLLIDLVKAGQMDVMAMPFNQTPFLNGIQWRQMMSWIPAELWRTLGIRLAMQNDVNGMPRAGGLALLDHGISHLITGSNDDSGGPPFPRPTSFWWRMPDGRKMYVWLGEHYGSSMRYLQGARDGNRFRLDDDSVRKAQAGLLDRLKAIEAMGYPHDRLILTFTNPIHYDNGGPFPTLAPFIATWNHLGLKPALRFTTATQAVFDMEKAIGAKVPTYEGEWTDWWANGDASAPREVAASRQAKRYIAAAMSPVFGSMPQRAQPDVTRILKDLCLFDEHTWGASSSISAPYSYESLGQFVEKSELAFRPYGMSQALLNRRIRSKIDSLPEGIYAINPSACELTGWVTLSGGVPPKTASLESQETHETTALYREGSAQRFWVEKFAPNSIRGFKASTTKAAALTGEARKPEVRLDSSDWPTSISWPGMWKPLFDGAFGEFLSVGVVPPAGRRTITQLHANPDKEKREAIRKTAFREVPATYAKSAARETPHTLIYTQEIRHERIAQAQRVLEVWRREPRVRLTIRFDRLSSPAPEVLFLSSTLPEELPLPQLSSGDVPFTPYRDQLGATCKDYFAIDGWARYATAGGHWLWVTRDAPLVAIGGPHVVELMQYEPQHPNRILAVVFDNFWHTNFVADSHGPMEFQFDLLWRENLAKPAELAAAVAMDPAATVNPAVHETDIELTDIYRP